MERREVRRGQIFEDLRETAESRDHRDHRDRGKGGGGRGEKGMGWEVEVQRNKLSKRERVERAMRYRGDVRCDGSWANDGSRVIDLSPLWLPSGCVSVSLSTCVCALLCLQLYSRPPHPLNTTGCRSKSLEHGLPVNRFPVHPRVTHKYTAMCSH